MKDDAIAHLSDQLMAFSALKYEDLPKYAAVVGLTDNINMEKFADRYDSINYFCILFSTTKLTSTNNENAAL